MYTSCRERKNHLKLVTPVSLCVCSVRCPCDRFAVQLCAVVARECLQFGAWLTELTSEVQVDAMRGAYMTRAAWTTVIDCEPEAERRRPSSRRACSDLGHVGTERQRTSSRYETIEIQY